MDNTKGKAKNMNNKRKLKCLKNRLTTKSGLIRGHIQGKRNDFTARTVITPEANGWVDELIVPEAFAKTLTYPVIVNKLNIEKCQRLLDEDKVNFIYRDDTCFTASKVLYTRGFELRENDIIIKNDRGSKSRISVYEYLNAKGKLPELQSGDSVERNGRVYVDVATKQRKDFKLREGDKIERQIQNGDWTLFNRQPTLWKGSMRAMKIKIMPGKTFRFNLACTSAYNADFDKISVENRRA